MIDANIAEAGLDLASANTADECCAALQGWVLRISGATQVVVEYRGAPRDMLVGGDLPDDDGRAPKGWHRIAIEHGDADEFSDWSAAVWLRDPQVRDWQRLVAILARHATLGLRRNAGLAILARHERQQHALVEAGKALSSERTLDGVLRRIVEQAMELTGARYGALGVLDESGESLARFVTVGIDAATQERIGALPTGRGILGVLIDDPRPLRLTRLQDDPRSVGFPEHHPPMESLLGVPIVTERAVAGRIYLTEKQDAPAFTLEDEQLVETLASQAAIAIDNASLNEQLQRTAAQLEEASRHKSTFLANMSHELRSPLNTIIGYTRLLLEDPRGLDQEQLEDLEIVRGSAEHLLALITELLDLQRIEAGRVTLVPSDEDLRSIVDAVVASVRPSVPDTVALISDTSQLIDPRIRCDRTRLRQILLNLLGNAAKFTEHGSITLTASDDGDRITLEVRDTGPGIPEADRARIFESFFQSQAALGRTPRPREGAGLGLAITRMLVQLHGGTVGLRSELGTGTVVTIQIPRNAEGDAS